VEVDEQSRKSTEDEREEEEEGWSEGVKRGRRVLFIPPVRTPL
jgi:hypothetical protein